MARICISRKSKENLFFKLRTCNAQSLNLIKKTYAFHYQTEQDQSKVTHVLVFGFRIQLGVALMLGIFSILAQKYLYESTSSGK